MSWTMLGPVVKITLSLRDDWDKGTWTEESLTDFLRHRIRDTVAEVLEECDFGHGVQIDVL